MVSIYDADAEALRTGTDASLRSLHARMRKVHKEDLHHVANDHRLGKLLAALARGHALLLDEFGRRGMAHPACPLDALSGRKKVRTDFGEFVVPAAIADLPAVRLSGKEAARVEAGDVSFVAFPRTPEAEALLARRETVAVLVAGASAIGKLSLLPPGRPVPPGSLPPNTIRLPGPGETLNLVGVVFTPFLAPVGAKLPSGAGPILAPGEATFASVPQIKRAENGIETDAVTPDLVGLLPDASLAALATALRERARPFFERGVAPESLVNALLFALTEADRRGRKLDADDPLDRAARALPRVAKDAGRAGDPSPDVDEKRAREIFAALPETMVVTPAFVSLTGSTLYPHKDGSPPGDLDVVYRCRPDALESGGLALKIERALKAIVGDGLPVQHVAEPTGPNFTHQPIYDLVLVKRPEFGIERVREDYTRFVKRDAPDDEGACDT